MQQMLKVLKVNKTGKKYYSRKVVKKKYCFSFNLRKNEVISEKNQ